MIAAVLLSAFLASSTQAAQDSALVYYNEACRDCVEYVQSQLRPLLAELGIEPVRARDYLNEPGARRELFQRSREEGVPLSVQGHLTVFISKDVILEGHVPAALIREVLNPALRSRYEKIAIHQDAMPEMGQPVTHYKVWSPGRPVATYEIGVPIVRYLEEHAPATGWEAEISSGTDFRALLPTVLATGLADGLNPCAFAVLILFLGIMFTLRRTRGSILAIGGVFIAMVYVAYLGIGLGLLRALTLFESPHFLAQAGAWLAIALGLINIKDAYRPGWGLSLRIPPARHRAIKRWLEKGTLTATAVGGFLVGLCTFPCSGGIYVAILGLLAVETTYVQGLGYLLAYNVAFVLPLVVILGVVSDRRTMGTLSRWEVRNLKAFKGLTGLVIVALGVGILFWLG
jgi:cytochrome c biogenesis protein CcdA